MIKAIETVYNGYRFRSRLEARWAVFFDTLGIKYEYEIEGFEFDDKLRYLPDFWLPGCKMWVEIKPILPTVKELKKCLALSDGIKNDVLIICGSPWPGNYTCKLFDIHSSLNQCRCCGKLSSDYTDLIKCSNCYTPMSYREYPYDYEIYEVDGLTFGQTDHHNLLYLNDQAIAGLAKRLGVSNDLKYPEYAGAHYVFPLLGLDSINLAYIAARQARFEHR